MTKKAKIPLQKIETLKKRLQKLPIKNTAKSREEAVEVLASSFQDALEKGYTPKELRSIFAEEGVALPLSLLRKHVEEEQHIPLRKHAGTVEKAADKEANSPLGIIIKLDTPDEDL